MNEGTFRKSLKLPEILFQMLGIEIFRKDHDNRVIGHLIKTVIFYLNLICLTQLLVGECYWFIDGIYTGRRVEDLCISVPCFVIGFLSLEKIRHLYFNRDVVEEIVKRLEGMHPKHDDNDFDVSKKERRIIKESLKFLNIVLVFFFSINACAVVVFNVTTVLSMGYDYVTMGHTEMKMPIPIKYFFEITTIGVWLPVFIHTVVGMIFASIGLTCTYMFFYVFCIYLQMHFRLLCVQFENVVSKRNKAKTKENIRKAVRRHQELIMLVEKMELLYSNLIFYNIIISSLLICVSGFIVTSVKDFGAAFSFVTFLTMNLAQISLLCYFGDMLTTASTEVAQAVYNSLWYEAELSIRKSLLILMVRTQKPCKITGMKFVDLNLTALSAILRTSWSYFALLQTMCD